MGTPNENGLDEEGDVVIPRPGMDYGSTRWYKSTRTISTRTIPAKPPSQQKEIRTAQPLPQLSLFQAPPPHLARAAGKFFLCPQEIGDLRGTMRILGSIDFTPVEPRFNAVMEWKRDATIGNPEITVRVIRNEGVISNNAPWKMIVTSMDGKYRINSLPMSGDILQTFTQELITRFQICEAIPLDLDLDLDADTNL